MKNNIFQIITGAMLIAAIVLFVGWQYFSTKEYEYRSQLENIIDNNYLEGENAIGAFHYRKEFYSDSIEIYKVSDFGFDPISWMLVSQYSFWGGQCFDHTELVIKMMRGGNYNWYELKRSATTYSPAMIIVKKTKKGYDVIGEFILGIGLTDLYPDYLISESSFKLNGGIFSNNKEIVTHHYKIKTNIINMYIDDLIKNKYNDITIRNEIAKDNDLGERSLKFEMLNNLVMKDCCHADSSLFFRVNKYFELKFDDDYTIIGSQPIAWHTGSYGNHAQTVFTKTVTMHYSIQENKDVLKNEYKEKVLFVLISIEILYLFLFVIILKRRKGKTKTCF